LEQADQAELDFSCLEKTMNEATYSFQVTNKNETILTIEKLRMCKI
jgi:hypothetical protein